MIVKIALGILFTLIIIVIINYLLRYKLKKFDFENITVERVLPVNKTQNINKKEISKIIIVKYKGVKKGYLIETKRGIYELDFNYDEELLLEFCKSNNLSMIEEEGFDGSREFLFKSSTYYS